MSNVMTSKAPSLNPRILLTTYPRTASNLLVKILSLDNQQDAFTPNELAGYHFAPAVTLTKDLNVWAKPMNEWADDIATRVSDAYQQGITDMETSATKGAQDGNIVFVKEHIQGLLHPFAWQRLIYGDGDDRDDSVGSNDSDSSVLRNERWKFQYPYPSSPAGFGALNDTMLPDEELRRWRPVFLIRHPALAFPSYWRVSRKFRGEEEEDPAGAYRRWMEPFMTLRFTRRLFDFYASRPKVEVEANGPGARHGHAQTNPIVLDADDIIHSPALVTRLADEIGLDASKLCFSWPARSPDELKSEPLIKQIMLSTLYASTGVLAEKATTSGTELVGCADGGGSGGIDLDKEMPAWKEEFGEEKAARLSRYIAASMADYEFFRAKRTR